MDTMPKAIGCKNWKSISMQSDYGHFEEQQLGKTYDIKLLRRLYPFIRSFRAALFGSVGLVVMITLLDLAVPYVTKTAVDSYIVPRQQASAAAQDNSSENRKRYITADITDPEIKKLVAKYPELFEARDGGVAIALKNQNLLNRVEQARLRARDISGLGRIALAFLAIVLANFIFNFFQRLIMEYTGHRIMHALRMALFSHIQALPVEFFTRNPVGRLVTRVTNDVQNMHELFTSFISFIFKDIFLLLGISAMLLYLNWKLALAVFTLVPLVIYAAVVFAGKARDVFRILRIKIAEINTRFSETIGGIKVIQMFNHQEQNYSGLAELNHENYLAGMHQIRILAVFLPAIEVIGMTATAIVIYYGGSNILTDSLSIGALVAFLAYLRMFFRPIRDLAEKYNILQNAMASAERIFLILDTERRSQITPAVGQPELAAPLRIRQISLDRVDFSYIAGEKVLKNVSFAIEAGQTVAIVGPTGSGKTSLINLLMGFYRPQSGIIRINGQDMCQISPAAYRSAMALVMQEPFLFSESIRDNIFRGTNGMGSEEMQSVTESANCTHLIDSLPEGLDTVLAESGSSISSGERQLLSIARAFARDPQVILFDEATSYIDSQTEMQIQLALDRLMKNRTAVIVAHRLSTIRHADNIIVLNHGRIVESGTHPQLIESQGFYYRLHQVQG